jgi:hypothetical protein
VGFFVAIEKALPRRVLLGLASQSGLEPLLHEALADMADGITVTVESLSDGVIGLIGAISIHLEQDMGLLDLVSGGFAFTGEVNELLAFFVAEPDNIFFVHGDSLLSHDV